MRLLSCFSASVQAMTHVFGKASLKNNIPNPARETKPSLHAAGGVMINVVLSDVFEIRIPEVVVVYAMVNPLFEDVGLHDPGHQHRSGVGRDDKPQQDR